MPSNNFLIFDENKSNMSSDVEYSSNSQRVSGVQTGLASSALQNKSLYQYSVISKAIADFINSNGLDAVDTSASDLSQNFISSTVGKIADKAATLTSADKSENSKYITPKVLFDFYNDFGFVKKYKLFENAHLTKSIGNSVLAFRFNIPNDIPSEIMQNSMAIVINANIDIDAKATSNDSHSVLISLREDSVHEIYYNRWDGSFSNLADNFSISTIYGTCNYIKYHNVETINISSNEESDEITFYYNGSGIASSTSSATITCTAYLLYLNSDWLVND